MAAARAFRCRALTGREQAQTRGEPGQDAIDAERIQHPGPGRSPGRDPACGIGSQLCYRCGEGCRIIGHDNDTGCSRLHRLGQIGPGLGGDHHRAGHRHDVEQLRRHYCAGDDRALDHAVDVASREELGQIRGIDEITEADAAGRLAGGEPFQLDALATGPSDDHRDGRREQSGGGDQHLQPLFPPEVSGIHRDHRLGWQIPRATEAVGARPRTHRLIIDPIGEYGDSAPTRSLGE